MVPPKEHVAWFNMELGSVKMNKTLPKLRQTMHRIQQLAASRENFISRTGQTLSIPRACHKLGIYPTILK